MMDLNDLRVFERVATLKNFSSTAKELGLPKSSVSRSISRLEEKLGIRLFQRSTRQVSLTAAGEVLFERSRVMLQGLEDAFASTAELAQSPRGQLVISAGIGFGVSVLARQLPEFLRRYPDVRVSIDLTSRNAELVSERVDVAIRMGEVTDSTMVATRLGVLTQYLCATRTYLDTFGRPTHPRELSKHQAIAMPSASGRPHPWRLMSETHREIVEPSARVLVNDALTICALVHQGTGIAAISAYLCGEGILDGRLERVLPDWSLAPLPVSLIFPSKRKISPAVRAFVDYMREANATNATWLRNTLVSPEIEITPSESQAHPD